MNFLFLCFGTTITSYYMKLSNEFRILKDLADNGYKVNAKNLQKIQKQILPDAAKISFLSMLIPGFNIIHTSKNIMLYNNTRHTILHQLNAIDCLEEMSEIEKEEYLKNPTGLNAFLVQLRYEIRLVKSSSISIDRDNIKGKIFYERDWTKEEITILKATGCFSKLTEEQIDKIKKEGLFKFAREFGKETKNEKPEEKQLPAIIVPPIKFTTVKTVDKTVDKTVEPPKWEEKPRTRTLKKY